MKTRKRKKRRREGRSKAAKVSGERSARGGGCANQDYRERSGIHATGFQKGKQNKTNRISAMTVTTEQDKVLRDQLFSIPVPQVSIG